MFESMSLRLLLLLGLKDITFWDTPRLTLRKGILLRSGTSLQRKSQSNSGTYIPSTEMGLKAGYKFGLI